MATVQALHPSQAHTPSIPAGQPALTSTPASNVPRGPVTATLNFYSNATDEIPHYFVEPPPDGAPQRNFTDVAHPVSIRDLRGKEAAFTLDTHAFAALRDQPHNPAIDWDSDASIRSLYYPEVEALLLKHAPGAQRVVLFDHTIRRAEPNAHRAPVTRAHIDQTAVSAAQRVHVHSPDEAAALLQGRYRIINVWRPLNGPVETFPLAFADSSTVADGDMVAVEHRYPDRTGETAAVRYSAGHDWWYWSGMANDERLLLQCFDSAAPGNRVPHSAFEDGRAGPQGKARESIEVRALIYG